MEEFLRRGVMYASLKISGTDPVDSERLKSSVKNGATISATAFSYAVGSGSKQSPFMSHC